MLSKIISFVNKYQGEIILFIGVILISLLSFGAGYITSKIQEKTPIEIKNINSN